jgi:transposase
VKVHRNCCGLDVHKETIAACILYDGPDASTLREKRVFGTITKQLRELAKWLHERKVTAVAMAASGIYWVPVWNGALKMF